MILLWYDVMHYVGNNPIITADTHNVTAVHRHPLLFTHLHLNWSEPPLLPTLCQLAWSVSSLPVGFAIDFARVCLSISSRIRERVLQFGIK